MKYKITMESKDKHIYIYNTGVEFGVNSEEEAKERALSHIKDKIDYFNKGYKIIKIESYKKYLD